MKQFNTIGNPVDGDLKVINRFAWTPTQVGNFRVWLQRYQQLFEYRVRECQLVTGSFRKIAYRCEGWILIDQKIKNEKATTSDPERVYH